MHGSAPNVFKMTLILGAIAMFMVISNVQPVEGIFFLDLLCATRIQELEKQVAKLVALQQSSTTQSTTPVPAG